MPKVSAKRQITLPVEQCKEAGINPGDDYESFIDNEGHITIITKSHGAAKGILAGIKIDQRITDNASLHDGMNR